MVDYDLHSSALVGKNYASIFIMSAVIFIIMVYCINVVLVNNTFYDKIKYEYNKQRCQIIVQAYKMFIKRDEIKVIKK